jgi:hypothetical protein
MPFDAAATDATREVATPQGGVKANFSLSDNKDWFDCKNTINSLSNASEHLPGFENVPTTASEHGKDALHAPHGHRHGHRNIPRSDGRDPDQGTTGEINHQFAAPARSQGLGRDSINHATARGGDSVSGVVHGPNNEVSAKLTDLISAESQLLSRNQSDQKADKASGGQDVGEVAHGKENEYAYGFRQAVEANHVEARLRSLVDKLGHVPIGRTSFAGDDLETDFAMNSLGSDVITNFRQEFVVDRAPTTVSVHDLTIVHKDGRILLTTPEGLALCKPDGKPMMAVELGSYLSSDGTFSMDGQGRIAQTGSRVNEADQQAPRRVETANHRSVIDGQKHSAERGFELNSMFSRDLRTHGYEVAEHLAENTQIESFEDQLSRLFDNLAAAVASSIRSLERKSEAEDELTNDKLPVADDPENYRVKPNSREETGNADASGTNQFVAKPFIRKSADDEESHEDGNSQETDDTKEETQKEVLSQTQASVINQNSGGQGCSDPQQPQTHTTTGQNHESDAEQGWLTSSVVYAGISTA